MSLTGSAVLREIEDARKSNAKEKELLLSAERLRDKFLAEINPLIKIYRLPGSSKEVEAINVYDLLTLIDQIFLVEEL